MRKMTAIALASIAMIPQFAIAQSGASTVVEKVRYCQVAHWSCFGRTPPEYRAWENHNIDPTTQRETYLYR